MSCNDWASRNLEDLCINITDGKHGDCKNQSNSGYYFVSVKDIYDSKINYENARQITETDFWETNKRTKLEPNDILITNSGTIGRMALVRENKKTRRTTFQKSVAILKPNTQLIDAHFLYYGLQANMYQLAEFAGGTTQQNLLLRDMRKFNIRFPKLSEQKAIADTLSCLDDKIELNNRINKNLEEMAQAIFKSWFVDFAPFQDGEFEDTELGPIPKGWIVSKIGNLDIIVSDYVANGSFASLKENVTLYETENYAVFLRNVDLKSNSFARYVDEPSYTFLAKSKLIGNEVIISNVGDVGSVYLCPRLSRPMTLGNNMIMLKPSSDIKYNYYLYLLFKYFYGKDLINAITGGSAQPKFNKTDFRSLIIIVPSREALTAFNRMVETTFEIQNSLLFENETLKTIRDSLLPKLMSGEIRVPIEEVQ